MKCSRYKYYIDHDFYCTQCGNKGLPVCRTNHNPGKAGHLKKLFCLQCDKETNHVECISNLTGHHTMISKRLQKK